MNALGRASFHDIEFNANFDKPSYLLILKWIQRFVILGDAPRRSITIAMSESLNLVALFISNCKLESRESEGLFALLRSLLNDAVFEEMHVVQVVPRYSVIIRQHLKIARLNNAEKQTPPLLNSLAIVKFNSFAFVRARLLPFIHRVDWGNTAVECADLVVSFCGMLSEPKPYDHALIPLIMKQLTVLVCAGLEANVGVRDFLARFSSFLLKLEFATPVIREMEVKMNDVNRKYHIKYEMVRRAINFFAVSSAKPVCDLPLRRLVEFLRVTLVDIDHAQDRPLFERSVLDVNVQFDLGIPLHLLAYWALRTTPLRSACEFVPNVDLFFREWALLPLRYHFAAELSHFAFARNSVSLLLCMEKMKEGHKNSRRFRLTFSLIQTLLMETTEKAEFLSMIAWTSGIFSDFADLQTKERHFVVFCFLHFICCLVYDRFIRSNDTLAMNRLTMLSHLILGSQKATDLARLFGNRVLTDSAFMADLATYTERVPSSLGIKFRLTNDSNWHPLIAFKRLSFILEVMSKHSAKPLIPFPPLPPELSWVLLSPILFACEFHILADPTIDNEAAQLVFNLLISAASIFAGALQTGDAVGGPTAHTLLDLFRLFEPLDFATFLRLPVAYFDRPPVSVLELLSNSEPGQFVLRRIGLSACPRSPSADESVQKPRVASMKAQIRRSFLERQNSFVPPAELQTGECCICHGENDEFLVYPVLIYRTILPDLADRDREPGLIYLHSVAVRICLHPVHLSCHRASRPNHPPDARDFLCPIDRSLRNGLLPRISGTAPISDGGCVASIDTFLSHITNAADPVEKLGVLVRSLAGQLTIIEVRNRSNRAIDTPPIAALLRNYFLAIWHRLRFDANRLQHLPPLEKLIVQALLSDEPIQPFVEPIGNEIEEPFRTAFYRRAALFIHFALRDCSDDTPDLETVFRDCPTVSLQPFKLCDLPADIFGFLETPFRIDIANNNDFEIAVCLLTGVSCVIPHGHWRIRNTIMLPDLINDRLDGAFSFFFVITGTRAGIVVAADMEFGCITELRSCYVDEFGEEDRGFVRGEMLTLSASRCAWLIDHLLAGDWADRMLAPLPRT